MACLKCLFFIWTNEYYWLSTTCNYPKAPICSLFHEPQRLFFELSLSHSRGLILENTERILYMFDLCPLGVFYNGDNVKPNLFRPMVTLDILVGQAYQVCAFFVIYGFFWPHENVGRMCLDLHYDYQAFAVGNDIYLQVPFAVIAFKDGISIIF